MGLVGRDGAPLEDAPLALVKHCKSFPQRSALIVEVVVFGQHPLLARRVIDQPVQPFAGIAVSAGRRVERRVAAQAAVHVDHFLLGDADPPGDELDLLGAEITLLKGENLDLAPCAD